MAHDRLRRALREPVLGFVLLGAGMFGLWWAGPGAAEREDDVESRTIVVDRERLGGELQARLGRAPAEDELAAAIDRWVDGEVLYREGLALGLDREDPVVRQRVIELVVAELERPSEPDDATLRAFMAENAARYTGAARYDFVLVTVPRMPYQTDDAPARQVLEALRGGADPKAVEGRLASGRRFSATSLTRTYGKEIAAAVMEQPPGEWSMIVIERGWTLVKVNARHAGEAPAFESVRNQVTLDWKQAQRGAARRQWMAELRGQHAVTREP
jgi:hypothetical protein